MSARQGEIPFPLHGRESRRFDDSLDPCLRGMT